MEFASVAGLPIVPGTVESRSPPEPDIVCEIEGRGRVAFELVTLFDEDLARTLSSRPRTVDCGGPTFEQQLKNLVDGSAFRRRWGVNLSPKVANRAVWLVHPKL